MKKQQIKSIFTGVLEGFCWFLASPFLITLILILLIIAVFAAVFYIVAICVLVVANIFTANKIAEKITSEW